MKDKCKYHPKEQARWLCPACETLFCRDCVPVASDKGDYPKCTLCRRTLTRLSIAKQIPPFSKQLPKLLVMPLKSAPLALIFIFAIIFSLLPENILGAVLFLLCLVPMIELMFDSMEQMASGEKFNLSLSGYLSLTNKNIFIKLLLVYFLSVFLIVKIYAVSAFFAYLITAFFILGVPASLIILMMEKSMLSMMNPVKIFYIVKLFGSAYWLLYFFVSLIAFVIIQVTPFFDADSINFFQAVVVYAFVQYLMFSVCLMAGYLVFQHHVELNFTIDRQQGDSNQDKRSNDPMVEIDIFIQEGRYEDAQTELLKRIEKNSLDYKANEKLILLYSIQGEGTFLNKIAEQYFIELVNKGKQKHAADFISKLHQRGVIFNPENELVIAEICNEMRNKNQFNVAIKIIENLLNDNKKPENWEAIYWTYIQLLNEFANRSIDAKKYLKLILDKSSNDELLKQVKSYSQLI